MGDPDVQASRSSSAAVWRLALVSRINGSAYDDELKKFVEAVSLMRFVSGHDFSRAIKPNKDLGFSPLYDMYERPVLHSVSAEFSPFSPCSSRPGGPTAKGQPSPEGLGISPDMIRSAVGAGLEDLDAEDTAGRLGPLEDV